jgi:hypothetical protein
LTKRKISTMILTALRNINQKRLGRWSSNLNALGDSHDSLAGHRSKTIRRYLNTCEL